MDIIVKLMVVVIVGICLNPLSSYATTIFTEDFEITLGDVTASNTPYNELVSRGWDVLAPCVTYCSMSIVNAPSGRSGKALRFTYDELPVPIIPPATPEDVAAYWAAEDGSHDAFLHRVWTGVPEIYERWYLRYERKNLSHPEIFDGYIGPKQHYINPNSLPDFMTLAQTGGGRYFIAVNQTSSAHLCPPESESAGLTDVTCDLSQNAPVENWVNIPSNTWVCVETHYSQSQVEIWINGSRVVNYGTTGVVYPALYDHMTLYRQGPGNEYRYEDDYVMATTRVGCSPPVECNCD